MKKIIPVLILLLMSCQSSTAPEKNIYTVKDYFPLAVGNYWKYQEITSEGEEYIDSIFIESEFEWEDGMSYSIEASEGYFTINDTMVRQWQDIPDTSRESIIWLKEPIKVGAEWIATEKSVIHTTFCITSIDTIVIVPAGTFENCVKVSRLYSALYYNIYAPNVGRVKTVYYDGEKELIDYEIK